MSSIPGRGNTSKKPDNKPAGQVVSFTRGAADRIAKVVRTVERGDTSAEGLRFTRPSDSGGGKVFRVCTFTGSWNINASKTVTFKYVTTTPNTVSVTNLFFPLTGTATRDCAIAKDGTAWFLIDVPFHTATAVFARTTAAHTCVTSVTTSAVDMLSSLSIAAVLNTSDCSISVSQTASTQSINVVSAVETSTITLLTSTFTSSFIRLEP